MCIASVFHPYCMYLLHVCVLCEWILDVYSKCLESVLHEYYKYISCVLHVLHVHRKCAAFVLHVHWKSIACLDIACALQIAIVLHLYCICVLRIEYCMRVLRTVWEVP